MDVRVGLRVAGFDHLVHVDAVVLREQRELVREPDVHIPVGGLGELRQLRRLRRAQIPHPVGLVQVRALIEAQRRLVELPGPPRPFLAERTDQLGVLAQVLEHPARQHPLGGEHREEVLRLLQPRDLLDHRHETTPQRPHRQRRLVGHQRARAQVLGQRAGRRVHPGEVRLPGRIVHEQRHHDHHRVRARDRLGIVRGRAELPRRDELGELLLELRLARERLRGLIDQLHLTGIDIDSDHLVTGIGELHRQRQSDLPQGDNSSLQLGSSSWGTSRCRMRVGDHQGRPTVTGYPHRPSRNRCPAARCHR